MNNFNKKKLLKKISQKIAGNSNSTEKLLAKFLISLTFTEITFEI